MLDQATESFQMQILRDEDVAAAEQPDGRSHHERREPGHPPRGLDQSTRDPAARERHPHRDRRRRGLCEYRIDGVLQPAMRPIDRRFHSTIISRVKVMPELDIAEKRVPQDGRFKLRLPEKTIDFRVSIMPSVHGEDAVIRILDKESISEQFKELRLDILGFPESELKRFRNTSPSRPGWSSSQVPRQRQDDHACGAVRDQVARDKIVTIEDPVDTNSAASRRSRSTRKRD